MGFEYNMPILVVDDDAMVRDILVEYLKSYGFVRITEAASSTEALKTIQAAGEEIRLVLSDWEMPTPTGLDLLRALKANPNRQNTKFIMITSQKSVERIKIAQAASAGVDAYIVKPFRAGLLKEKIWAVMGWNLEEKKQA